MTRERWVWIAVCVALLALGGARERIHVKKVDSLTVSVSVAQKAVTEAQERAEKAVRERDLAIKRSRKTHKITWPDGRIEETTEDTEDLLERTRETVEATFKSKIDTLTSENVSLRQKVSLYEKDVTKSAPRWNLLLSVPVLAYSDVTRYEAGGGMNLGPLSVSVTNPLALKLDPRLQVMLRF